VFRLVSGLNARGTGIQMRQNVPVFFAILTSNVMIERQKG
jgi:hypothetical protein